MKFNVGFTDDAEADLDRLFEFLLDRAETHEELEAAIASIETIRKTAKELLESMPFVFRKIGRSPLRREVVIPHRSSGYVALYEIEGGQVLVLAVRHQLEDDTLSASKA